MQRNRYFVTGVGSPSRGGKAKIETDVKAAGSKLATLKIDPWLFGVGVGYRF